MLNIYFVKPNILVDQKSAGLFFHPNPFKPTPELSLFPIHLKFQIQIIINPQILRS